MAADTKDQAPRGDDVPSKDAHASQDQPSFANAKSEQEKAYSLPKIDFSTFVLSLNSSILVQLGLIEDPVAGQKSKNMAMAKQTIDLLSLLEEKTKGNLTEQEENILKNILYELRLLYVQHQR
jgi:hypothetical protein